MLNQLECFYVVKEKQQYYLSIMGFWKHIKEWLNKEGVNTPPCSQPISHTTLKRTEEEIIAYNKWKSSKCKDDMLSYISQNFKVWKNTPCEQCDGIDFLKMNSFRGFVVHFMDLDKNCNEVRYLFDYLKEKVQKIGYKSYLSDTKEFQKARWIETVERHYLKPPINLDGKGKQDQLFGNINIELLFRDDEPLHLKFAACTYQDSQYSDASDFETLLTTITQVQVESEE